MEPDYKDVSLQLDCGVSQNHILWTW